MDGRSGAPVGRMSALWILPALGIATTIGLNSGVSLYGWHTFASAAAAAPGVAIACAVTLLAYLAGRRARWALAALVIVTTADLGLWGFRYIYREPPRALAELTQGIPDAPATPADSYAWAPAVGPYSHDVLVLRGYRLTSGYVALYPVSTHPLESDAARRLSGTRWIFTRDGVRQPALDGVDRVRLLDGGGLDASGAARLAIDRPGYLVADVDVPGPRVLALTERFHDGWSATSGGVPLQIVRVEGDFLGCRVEAGVHRVTLRFMPRSFVYGSLHRRWSLTLLAAVLVARLR